MLDIEKLKKLSDSKNRYQKRISQLQDDRVVTTSIEESIEQSIKNLEKGIKSFVIYWEPQSWKTELMIALTAKLLDEWNKIIVLLVNDNVQLLNQNLERFRKSWLDPTPHSFLEILDKSFKVSNEKELVVFCTKNSKNLQKLIQKIWDLKNKIIIDDEADYATPNSKINNWDITKINELVWKLISNNWTFIWVTATPARLDLNNTFWNQNDNWVNFKPHPYYTWQEIFFPDSWAEIKYDLQLMPECWDDPKYIRNALFHFMINVAYLNTIEDWKEKNYSMLVHTSWKKSEQWEDYEDIIKIFNDISDLTNPKNIKFLNEIYEIAKNKFPWNEDEIIEYIYKNKDRKAIVMINSDADKDNVNWATDPNTPFTIAIGGNIVSRWVTFNNLLCMFFTRDVKHKIQQDTYIQRARMFWSRWKYLKYFMLFIPENLFKDWQRAFVYHRLALESIKKWNGLVWLEDSRISAASTSSIDKTFISLIRWEMSFWLFNYTDEIDKIISNITYSWLEKLYKIQEIVWENCLPNFLIDFIKVTYNSDQSWIYMLGWLEISWYSETYVDKENILNTKESFLTRFWDLKVTKSFSHWIRPVYYSWNNKARIYYRYNNEKIKFLKNIKHD